MIEERETKFSSADQIISYHVLAEQLFKVGITFQFFQRRINQSLIDFFRSRIFFDSLHCGGIDPTVFNTVLQEFTQRNGVCLPTGIVIFAAVNLIFLNNTALRRSEIGIEEIEKCALIVRKFRHIERGGIHELGSHRGQRTLPVAAKTLRDKTLGLTRRLALDVIQREYIVSDQLVVSILNRNEACR